MPENKTKATDASVKDYLAAIDDEARRKDCEALSSFADCDLPMASSAFTPPYLRHAPALARPCSIRRGEHPTAAGGSRSARSWQRRRVLQGWSASLASWR
jgi:hypothetical protein